MGRTGCAPVPTRFELQPERLLLTSVAATADEFATASSGRTSRAIRQAPAKLTTCKHGLPTQDVVPARAPGATRTMPKHPRPDQEPMTPRAMATTLKAPISHRHVRAPRPACHGRTRRSAPSFGRLRRFSVENARLEGGCRPATSELLNSERQLRRLRAASASCVLRPVHRPHREFSFLCGPCPAYRPCSASRLGCHGLQPAPTRELVVAPVMPASPPYRAESWPSRALPTSPLRRSLGLGSRLAGHAPVRARCRSRVRQTPCGVR